MKFSYNRSPQFENVYASQIFVENFTVRTEEDGVRNRRLPRRIERRLHGRSIIRSKQEVAAGGMCFLEHPHDAVLFVGHVGGNRDQIEIANLIHLKRFLKIGKLVDTRITPGRPETN